MGELPGLAVQWFCTLWVCSTLRGMDWGQRPAQVLAAGIRLFRQETPGPWVSTVGSRKEGPGTRVGTFLWCRGCLLVGGVQPEEGQSEVSKVWGQISALYRG